MSSSINLFSIAFRSSHPLSFFGIFLLGGSGCFSSSGSSVRLILPRSISCCSSSSLVSVSLSLVVLFSSFFFLALVFILQNKQKKCYPDVVLMVVVVHPPHI